MATKAKKPAKKKVKAKTPGGKKSVKKKVAGEKPARKTSTVKAVKKTAQAFVKAAGKKTSAAKKSGKKMVKRAIKAIADIAAPILPGGEFKVLSNTIATAGGAGCPSQFDVAHRRRVLNFGRLAMVSLPPVGTLHDMRQ